MNHYDMKAILEDLRCAYRAEYQRLQGEYQMKWRNGALDRNVSEDDYILEHLPQLLKERSKTFAEEDIARQVRSVLPLFSPEKCAAVVKDRYPTGYKQLDAAMDGGFVSGVHYIGAVSSVGKSTFSLQMADQMAANGIPVVYVSLEMSQLDLTAKLLSLHTFTDVGGEHAWTATELTSNRLFQFQGSEWADVNEAIQAIAAHRAEITILDGRAHGISVDEIARYMRDYVRTYDVVPVIIIDYLQILKPAAGMERATDKQLVDYNVSAFKALAAEYDIPVIVISSFNRDGYDIEAGPKSYKDSGNIEYSSDTLIALQLRGVGKTGFDPNAAKAAYPRKIELSILKQRYGCSGTKIAYDFYTKYNFFEELPQVDGKIDIQSAKNQFTY